MAQDTRQLDDAEDVCGHPFTGQLPNTDQQLPHGQEDASFPPSIRRTKKPESLASVVHQTFLDGGLQHFQVTPIYQCNLQECDMPVVML